ncbi:KAP family P-loop NTPase fold protein [Glutamicibacter sp. Je.9.36]|uniref:KAP family P-loop NTPase fold protein n=1 Tax=Glutamicibacter sp. Je.9.36 TaxID=3142837 RepID=UPI003DA9A4A3
MDFRAKELIDDKEVSGLDEDRLSHDGVAIQLAELVCSVPTPSNIALYGPWGSGKSGIGNLLATKLKTKSGVKFARFDAFKYAENPLRRNFVSVVATSLGVRDSRFHDDLYRGRTTTDFAVPTRKLFSLLWIFTLVVFVAVLVSSGSIWLVAALQGKDVFAELIRIGTATLPASLVPASLLTAVIALVGKTFTSEKRVERAESDEEFESLLTDLVEESGANRVVIFVDELDRCSSDEVVETLNAVRTFLGVDRCVFVVAADQQVLERALTDTLSQPTLIDTLNPYYSAGSAYLDKVFQYQMSVPPLMPQSIISFVVELIEGRPGVWQHIDVPVVVSILIPSHVRSPRRVKNLLNAFVLSYRLAQSRVESKQLDLDVLASIDELARIVCLRIEFPLFARDLIIDSELSEYVRDLSEPNAVVDSVWEKYPYVDDATRRVAEEYARGVRPVERLLAPEEEVTTTEEIHSPQGQQLIDYLRRTRSVKGPTKSLIHLQNTGSLYGLPASVAEQLERDAQNASFGAVIKTFDELDTDARAAAIQLLIQQGRVAVGLEAPNIASAILAVVAKEPAATRPFANEIALVVSTAIGEDSDSLSDATAAGAWEIAIMGSRPEADKLGQMVLESDLATTDDDLLRHILHNGRKAVSLSRTKISELIVHLFMAESPEDAAEALLAVDEAHRFAVLKASEDSFTKQLVDAISDFVMAEEARKESEKTARASDEEDLTEHVLNPDDVLAALGHLLGSFDAEDPSASVVLRILLKIGKLESRDIVQKYIGDVTIRDGEIAALVLEQAVHRRTELWSVWLKSWPAQTFASDTRCAGAIVELVRVMWHRATINSKDLNEEEILSSAVSVASLLDHCSESARASATEIVSFDTIPTNDGEVATHLHRVAVAEFLARTGVISREDLAEKRADVVILSLDDKSEEEETESVLAEWVLSEVAYLLEEEDTPLPSMSISRLVTAGSSATWLSVPDEVRLRVRLLEQSEFDISNVLRVSAADVRSSQEELSEAAFADLIQRWLRSTEESVSEVLPVLMGVIEKAPKPLLSAVSYWRARQTTANQYTLLESFISKENEPVPSTPVLQAVGLNDLDEASVASLIVDRYLRCTTNENRKSALKLAELAHFSVHAARRRVILEIIIPMLSLNSSAAEIALFYALRLAKPFPSGSKNLLGDAMVAAGSNFPAVSEKAYAALHTLGFSIRRKGLFRRGSEISASE